ncbi:MAG: hypothetical protein QW478_15800 [Candidatus Micrarchaeaceae archaeon]
MKKEKMSKNHARSISKEYATGKKDGYIIDGKEPIIEVARKENMKQKKPNINIISPLPAFVMISVVVFIGAVFRLFAVWLLSILLPRSSLFVI